MKKIKVQTDEAITNQSFIIESENMRVVIRTENGKIATIDIGYPKVSVYNSYWSDIGKLELTQLVDAIRDVLGQTE